MYTEGAEARASRDHSTLPAHLLPSPGGPTPQEPLLTAHHLLCSESTSFQPLKKTWGEVSRWEGLSPWEPQSGQGPSTGLGIVPSVNLDFLGGSNTWGQGLGWWKVSKLPHNAHLPGLT